jgi:2-C-methyl-D-erythritol 2,4-cyclodiphosphate synthase
MSQKAWPRVGVGWDVHPLEEGRPFLLAGVVLTDEFGPSGHSDGDVLAHALADALFGAAGLADIGTHFPDTDDRWRGVGGIEILRRTREILSRAGFHPLQVDAVVVCDRPKLAPRREEIRRAVARALGLDVAAVGLKGKRTEGLGGLSEARGVGCHAVATVLPPELAGGEGPGAAGAG